MVEYSFKDFSSIITKKTTKIVERRFRNIKPAIEKEVVPLARKLFKWMSQQTINVKNNRFPTEYTRVPKWAPLNRRYAQEKGNTAFWYNRGVLDAYLYNTNPFYILGKPKVDVSINKNSEGVQYVKIEVIPYPRANSSINVKGIIYNRLFAKTKRRLGPNKAIVYKSNEEVRPIFEPSLLYFANTKIDRAIRMAYHKELNR